ncbi:unnamed protein product, partial [Rotaria sp. Silwood2]
MPSASEVVVSNIPNRKREIKLARNMMILLNIYSLSGMPITILLFWNLISPNNPPPASLYSLASNCISLFNAIM